MGKDRKGIDNSMSPKLHSLELEISNPCNERCVHCYRTCDETRKGFLSLADVKKIVASVKPICTLNPSGILTGGEVTLNPEWKKIFEFLVNENFRINFYTNGTNLTETDCDFLALHKDKIIHVQISLYAMDAKIHDAVTRVKGSFEKTMRGISLLREKGIPLFISCPAMQANKNDFYKVMLWADESNIPSCTILYIFSSADYSFSNDGQKLTAKDLENFYAITKKNNGALSYVWKSKHEKDLNKILFYGAAFNSLLISGDGTIYPMIGWYEKLGNIATDDVADIFLHHSLLQKIRTIKASDIPECKVCSCVDYCSFSPMAHLNANHGELYKLDASYCKHIAQIKKYAERFKD